MRVVLCFFFALFTAPAWAEWVEVGRGEDQSSIAYADPTAITPVGENVSMLHLWNLRTPETISAGKKYLSIRTRTEFNCREEKTRRLIYEAFAGNMAQGEVMVTSDPAPGDWKPVPPVSLMRNIWKVACGKQ